METPQKKKKPALQHPVITFRAPPVVKKQIEALCELWGLNQTQVIYSVLQSCYDREFEKNKK